jgi:primosomal protein N' (replication factor Y)
LYTYAVPPQMDDKLVAGMRVEVQFGKQKLYTAIVHSVQQEAPSAYVPKEILSIIDEQPIVTDMQLQFWEWIASYYMCTVGEVMQAAVPASFKLDSETYFVKNHSTSAAILDLPDDEYMVAEALNHQEEISLQDITQILQKKSIGKTVRSLLDKKIISIKETLHEKYTPKKEMFVVLNAETSDLKHVFDSVSKYPKQEAVLLAYIELAKSENAVKRAVLLKRAGAGMSSLDALVKRDVFRLEEKTVARLQKKDAAVITEFSFSREQATALESIRMLFLEKETVLLHGVTSSGKTLLYVDLIREQLQKGNQVLYLLPEIALTAQLIGRLEKVLGAITVYHSKFNNAERVEIWNSVLSGDAKVIVGARSSVFLPFKKLGLVIVDEEHDTSYKQYEPAPRYQCRDAAIYLAKQFQAKVLLGSATPSVESYSNARTGKYGLVKMLSRYGDIPLPELEFISLAEAHKKKEIVTGITFLLRDEIQAALNRKKQIILFQNRRGYAPYLACSNCNWIPMCRNCDVSLTYHKFTNDLRCHYCGYIHAMIGTCAACGTHAMQQKGLGTERIEEDLRTMFPAAKIGRMDYDTVRTKKGHEKIVEAFEEGEFDILVGTQMVTKGLDFGNVSLVGVLNADALLYYPDFRAFERAYQLLVQVSGRAGRRDKRGKVMIQIGNVHHEIADVILKNDYDSFYRQQMQERRAFHYPPYSRLIRLTVKHKDNKTVIEAAHRIASFLDAKYTGFITGPNAPIIQKINNYYLRDILVKIPKSYRETATVKAFIREAINGIYQYQSFRQVKVLIDVDCY